MPVAAKSITLIDKSNGAPIVLFNSDANINFVTIDPLAATPTVIIRFINGFTVEVEATLAVVMEDILSLIK